MQTNPTVRSDSSIVVGNPSPATRDRLTAWAFQVEEAARPIQKTKVAAMDDTGAGLLNWVLAAFGTVVSVLAGVISMFYRNEKTSNATAIADLQKKLAESDQKHDECQKSREDLSRQCAVLAERMTHLERQSGIHVRPASYPST